MSEYIQWDNRCRIILPEQKKHKILPRVLLATLCLRLRRFMAVLYSRNRLETSCFVCVIFLIRVYI